MLSLRPNRLAAAVLVLLASLAALTATPARAGGGGSGIVYDPWNHTENILTQVNTLNTYAQQVQQYIMLGQQYATMVEQLKRYPGAALNVIPGTVRAMGNSGVLSADDVQSAMNLYRQVNAAAQAAQQVQGLFQMRQRQMSSMGIPWAQYANYVIQRTRTMREAGQRVFEAEERAVSTANEAMERVIDLNNEIPESSGIHHSAMMTNRILVEQTAINAQMLRAVTIANQHKIEVQDMERLKKQDDEERAIQSAMEKRDAALQRIERDRQSVRGF